MDFLSERVNDWNWILHFIWLDVMMLRWLCCKADVMLLLVLFRLMGVGDTSDEACVVMLAFVVFVCSCALEVDVVVVEVVVLVPTADAVIVVSATVVAAVLLTIEMTPEQ